MSLQTKNVFLTGGAMGIGRFIVEKLLAAGAKVVFVDINAEAGKAAETEYAAKYGADKVHFIRVDVTDFGQLEDAFSTAVDMFGFVDLMVNNAGILHEGKWEVMIQLNYAAIVKGTLMAREHMRKDKGGRGGRIINTSSQYGMEILLSSPVYTGTKHAIRAFTSALAYGLTREQTGVEYGVLCPGPTATPLVSGLTPDSVHDFDLSPEEYKTGAVFGPAENVADGFMRLATQENLNGAILYVHKDECEYQKIERSNIPWPPTA